MFDQEKVSIAKSSYNSLFAFVGSMALPADITFSLKTNGLGHRSTK